MIKPGINIYKGAKEIALELCIFLEEKLKKNYTVALPGGNTPREIFKLISLYNKVNVNWNNLHFFWGDERCVGPEHNDSNYRMANENLLIPLNIQANRIHRIHGEDDPVYEADRYTVEVLKNVPNRSGFASFDLMILGMGDDGHTASIFPGQDKILGSTRVCDVAVHPETSQKRITLTLETINHSDNIIFLITGRKKAKILSEIIDRNGNWLAYPASKVNPIYGTLYWMLDEDAASYIREL